MTILAAVTIGFACALAAGAVLGTMPAMTVGRRGLGRRLEGERAWLHQAGVPLTPVRFWAGSAAAAFIALLALLAVTGSLFVALAPALAIGAAPRAYFARHRRVRMRAVQAAWPDGLRDVLASIAAGRTLPQAVGALAATGPLPLRAAFARFAELARVLGTVAALELVKEDLADPTSDRVLEVLVLAHERGGAVVRAVLADLVDATTRDLKLFDELETEGLEMRINARAVVVLPWLVLVALTARPGAFRDFYRSTGGVVTLVIAGGLSIVGIAVLGRLARDPVELRVFAGSESAA